MSALGHTGAPTKAQREESDQLSRDFLALKHCGGFTGDEIAQMFGVVNSTVFKRIRRAREGCTWNIKPRGPNRHAS